MSKKKKKKQFSERTTFKGSTLKGTGPFWIKESRNARMKARKVTYSQGVPFTITAKGRRAKRNYLSFQRAVTTMMNLCFYSTQARA